ncbi:hypothetical protein [Pseudanabaena yagii]|uniref:Uncharacterized protein n=1 Tax=Pseudanabaena yagii GIHE-NHR1 TaxID=2722753 RepID=A0ABX1LZ79_9CYAN|nr:hypothetical protein [Pseudanabaena yagii]NMF57711.1 hypothetical protein [Pseudanabaena yagii GIHE-NHR1]NMF60074.1 hypothetical protein [Pseudanabaena yagii GIHE-NHR1]
MMSEPFKPFLINDRSSALINFIDASQFTESELVDVYLGMCDRLKHLIELKPTMSFEIHQPSPELTNETVKGLMQDLNTDEKLLFEVEPLEAYMILGMMQAAIVSLGIPENLEKFGRKFIKAFCDRYRIMFPDVVKTLEMGWTTCMTSEEFDDLIDSDENELSVEDFLGSGVLIRVGNDFQMPDIPTHFPDDYVDDFA